MKRPSAGSNHGSSTQLQHEKGPWNHARPVEDRVAKRLEVGEEAVQEHGAQESVQEVDGDVERLRSSNEDAFITTTR